MQCCNNVYTNKMYACVIAVYDKITILNLSNCNAAIMNLSFKRHTGASTLQKNIGQNKRVLDGLVFWHISVLSRFLMYRKNIQKLGQIKNKNENNIKN